MIFDMDAPVKVTRFGKINQPKGRWHCGRVLGEHLLIYLTQNELSLKIGENLYTANSGDMLLVPRGTFYAPISDIGCSYYFFHFSATLGEERKETLKIHETQNLIPGDYDYAYNSGNSVVEVSPHTVGIHELLVLCRKCAQLDVFSNEYNKLLMDNLLREILITAGQKRSDTAKSDRTLRKLLLFMQENYFLDINISTLSEKFGLSVSYISRLFREKTESTVSQQLNRLRLSAAKDMIINSDMRIGEIAFAVGYKSEYYFSRVFKKQYKISPMSFRHGG